MKRRHGMKTLWADPEFRRRRIATFYRPAVIKAKRRAGRAVARALWDNPELRRQRCGAFLAGWAAKAHRERIYVDQLRARKGCGHKRRILELLAEGYRLDQIARHIGRTHRTIKQHTLEMHAATGTSTLAGLVAWAFRKKLVE
jgi:DNA-binding CsgD family transcriptional regulator